MKKRLIAIVLCAVLAVLAAGGIITYALVPHYAFESGGSLTFVDPMGNSEYYESDGVRTLQTERAKYVFSGALSTAQLNKFVQAQERLFDYLIANGYAAAFKLTIYVTAGYRNSADAGRRVLYELNGYYYQSRADAKRAMIITHITNAKTQEHVMATLFTIYGETANYGLVYGLSNKIAKDLHWNAESPKISNAKLEDFWSNADNLQLLDLTYPCFIRTYSALKNHPALKKTAIALVDYILAIDSGDTLKNLLFADLFSFEQPFVQARNAYLASIGSATRTAPKEIPIQFGYGGEVYPLLMKTSRVTYHLSYSFYEAYARLFGIDYFNSDYSSLLYVIETMETEMTVIDKKLKDDTYAYGNYNVVLVGFDVLEKIMPGAIGCYSFMGSITHSCTAAALLHEYIHHITRLYDSQTGNLYHEVIAHYYGDKTVFKDIFRTFYYQEVYASDYIKYFRAYTGREYEISDAVIYHDIYNAVKLLTNETPYIGQKAISFAEFLKRSYGEEVMIALLIKYRMEPQLLVGKSWDEIEEAWKDWLRNEFFTILEPFFPN